jgi:hypothetical protein
MSDNKYAGKKCFVIMPFGKKDVIDSKGNALASWESGDNVAVATKRSDESWSERAAPSYLRRPAHSPIGSTL